MEEILRLRQELAKLLGFGNYAELSLATKMAESTDAGRALPA
jgi:oligopeptidase A